MYRDGTRLLFFATCAFSLGSTSASAQATAGKPDKAKFDEYWTAPTNGYEQAFRSLVVEQVDSHINMIRALCREKEPLRPEQEATLRKSAEPYTRWATQEAHAEMLVWGSKLDGGWPDKLSPAHMQFVAIMQLRLGRKQAPLLDRVLDKWGSIASETQREASIDWLNYQFRGERRKKGMEQARRRAAGQFTEADLKGDRVDPNGPRDLHDLPIPRPLPPEGYWHYRATLFVRRHGLNRAQQEAARSILEESQRRAQRMREGRQDEVDRAWKRLIAAYLFPKESKVKLKDAVREYRRVSQASVRPIFEKMQKRLKGLLTAEQKNAAGTPPPKPRWLELMEAALAEEEAEQRSPSAASRPAGRQ